MIKGLILKHALKNAVSYGGKCNLGAVIGRVLAENPKFRSKVDEIRKEAVKICVVVSRMSLIEQEVKLLEIAPEMLNERKVETRVGLPELSNAKKGKVVMRFEPSPSGALHIGHSIPFLLNAGYCKKYNGKLFLRISDTNPAEIHVPAYKLIPEEAKWLTKQPFTVRLQSDNMNAYYKYAEKLIKKGKAYVCCCSRDVWKNSIDSMKPCKHRSLSLEIQMTEWKKMFSKYKPGDAVLRIKTDLNSKNPALREWPAFRISDDKHPKQGKKYRVWPLMNFSVAIDDHEQGMTHVIRGKDHVVNTERQIFLFEYFGWKIPEYIHIGRINFTNTKIPLSASGATILIDERKVSGWGDIRMPFIAALRKRGILADSLAQYAIEIGPSKVDKTVSIDQFMNAIYDYNRKSLDDVDRYFFVSAPKKITIKDAPKISAKLPLHPEKKKGYRTLKTTDKFYLSKEDFSSLKQGKIYRLMHLFNFTKKAGKFVFQSEEYDPSLKAKLLHWLPADDKQISKVELKMPDGKSQKGFAENAAINLTKNSIIQFERVGFCMKQGKNEFWFGHR